MLLMSTYVASVIDDLIIEARALRLQMHVNLVSVRCLSAVYRLLIGSNGQFLNLRPLLYYPDYYSDFWEKNSWATPNRAKKLTYPPFMGLTHRDVA